MTLVCHEHGFIFLKTRKTAGTSVEMLLERLSAPPGHVPVEYGPTVKDRRGVIAGRPMPGPKRGWRRLVRMLRPPPWIEHMPAEHVRRRIGTGKFERYRKLVTVRNPFTRAVSQFHWMTRKTPEAYPDDATLRARFREILLRPAPNDHEIVHADGALLDVMPIRVEHLRDDLDAAIARLDLPIGTEALAHMKDLGGLKKGRPLGAYYDDEIADIVRERYDWYFTVGGYDRALPVEAR